MEGGKAPTSLITFSGELVYWLSGSKRPPPPRPTSKETGVLIFHPSINGDIRSRETYYNLGWRSHSEMRSPETKASESGSKTFSLNLNYLEKNVSLWI